MKMHTVVLAVLLSSAVGLPSTQAFAASNTDNFQIMKATDNKIWRLNKVTGEISVCTLDGERLVCTSSTEAMRPPAMTYEERASERKRLKADQDAKELQFVDRVLTAVRTLFEASMERDRDTPIDAE